MAASMELRCWGGDWGLPSVHTESLIVLVNGSTVTEPAQILNFLRKQVMSPFLPSQQGAGTMAYIALLEEKLRPALLHTFWVDSENYANLTRPWFASRSPFRHNFLVPCRHANMALSRILLTKGDSPLHTITEVEGKVGESPLHTITEVEGKVGQGDIRPSSLDAFVFGSVALLHKASLPSSPLQSYFRQLDNLQRFCDHILDLALPCSALDHYTTQEATNGLYFRQCLSDQSELMLHGSASAHAYGVEAFVRLFVLSLIVTILVPNLQKIYIYTLFSI
uniref:Metaxin 3 n=1 Tax=Salmo trutta TaxID=8032 RepID=A0A674BG02_SALTR